MQSTVGSDIKPVQVSEAEWVNTKSQCTLPLQEPPMTHLRPCKVGGGGLTAVNISQVIEDCDSSPQKCFRIQALLTVLTGSPERKKSLCGSVNRLCFFLFL